MCTNFTSIIILSIILFTSNIQAAIRVKRVVGGQRVPYGDFSIAVSIKNSTSLLHLCGGTFITPKLVITAAHCVEHGYSNDYQVFMENLFYTEYNLNFINNLIDEGKIHFDIAKIHIHDLYNNVENTNDIALLEIKLSYPFSNYWTKRILPESSFGLTGQCNVYGYGATEMNSEKTFNSLRTGTVTIISDEECSYLLGHIAPKPNTGMICALGDSADACQGDSGSALICNGKLEGIVSYGMGCGIKNLPGVYTRVSTHMKWIKKIINLTSLQKL